KSAVTNNDGRTDELLLDADEMVECEYELRFDVGNYFSGLSENASQPGFLNVVPIRFTITNAAEGYHVPLLGSPWSFSTYRGS
ncbi:MAG: hydroxyisourate hydrolase, partial [Rhizobiaceae bacterium]